MVSGGTKDQVESDLDAEIAELSAAISRNPTDAEAHRRRGLLKTRSRRYTPCLGPKYITTPSRPGFRIRTLFRYALRRRFRGAVNEMMDCADGAKLRASRNNAVGSVDRQADMGVAAAALHPHR